MMFATAALPLTVEPIIGESATSLASRLAWRNGAPRLITFCSDLGIDHRGLTNGAEAEIHRVAALAGQDPEPLLFWTPRLVEPGWFQLGQERIKFTALSRTRTWACPLCLAECPADTPLHTGHPGPWQLDSIRSCARHGCALVPMPTAPSNKDVFDFARIVERYAPAAPAHVAEPHMALEHYLIARIAGENPGGGWLDGLPLHVAAQTSENLGILMTLGPDVRRSEIADLQWIEAGAAGYRILAEGPEALHQLLADMKRGYVNDAGRYRARYRFFFEWLRYRDDDRAFDTIRDLVREFVWKNFPVARGALVLGKECPRQFVHSLSTAVRATGITKRQLGRRLCSMGLATPNGNALGFDIHDYIPEGVLATIAAEFSGLLNATEAAAYLGIKPFLLTQLTRPDLIPVYLRAEKALPLYHVSALSGFMGRLDKLRENAAPQKSWADIATAAHRTKIPTEKAVALVLLHKLALRCPHGEAAGFRDFRIDPVALRDAIGLPEQGAVHPARAAQLLHLPIGTVSALLKHRHLGSVPVKRPAPARPLLYVCAYSIDTFPDMYVSRKELAQHIQDRDPLALMDDQLSEFRIDLGKNAEPIYRREVLDIL